MKILIIALVLSSVLVLLVIKKYFIPVSDSASVLENAIRNACYNLRGVYKEEVLCMLSADENSDVEKSVAVARRNYLNAVCDAVKESIAVSAPSIYTKFNLALFCPSVSGLPSEMDTDYLSEYGISAGAAFALLYYAIYDKPISTDKHYRILSALNHYQNDIMEEVLKEIEE